MKDHDPGYHLRDSLAHLDDRPREPSRPERAHIAHAEAVLIRKQWLKASATGGAGTAVDLGAPPRGHFWQLEHIGVGGSNTEILQVTIGGTDVDNLVAEIPLEGNAVGHLNFANPLYVPENAKLCIVRIGAFTSRMIVNAQVSLCQYLPRISVVGRDDYCDNCGRAKFACICAVGRE